MPKPRMTIRVRIPPYQKPRYAWRRAIHKRVLEKVKQAGVEYTAKDRLEVWAKFYFDSTKVRFMDVDNRVKDVLDALQGRVGGPKNSPGLSKIIPNDSRVYRIVVEKGIWPSQSQPDGHLLIRKLSGSLRLVWKGQGVRALAR